MQQKFADSHILSSFLGNPVRSYYCKVIISGKYLVKRAEEYKNGDQGEKG